MVSPVRGRVSGILWTPVRTCDDQNSSIFMLGLQNANRSSGKALLDATAAWWGILVTITIPFPQTKDRASWSWVFHMVLKWQSQDSPQTLNQGVGLLSPIGLTCALRAQLSTVRPVSAQGYYWTSSVAVGWVRACSRPFTPCASAVIERQTSVLNHWKDIVSFLSVSCPWCLVSGSGTRVANL